MIISEEEVMVMNTIFRIAILLITGTPTITILMIVLIIQLTITRGLRVMRLIVKKDGKVAITQIPIHLLNVILRE